VSDQEVEATADWVRAQAKAHYEMQDFLTKQEQEERRMQQNLMANDMLAMDGIDADDSAVAMHDGSGDEYDYTYQQQRRDGISISEALKRGAAAAPAPRMSSTDESDAIDEELFSQAARLILTHRKASVSLLQRKLKIGFARAGRVMDMLEERGIVGPNVGSKVREILVDPDEYVSELEGEEDDVRF
jgi:DNA segregation ATPase FtsK/SpoIIIE-like protein